MTSGTKSNSSVVAMLEVRHNGKQVIVPVAVGGFGFQNGIQMDVNTISSVYEKSVKSLVTEAIAQENAGDIGIFYAKKEAMTLPGAGVQFPVQLQQSTASDGIVHKFSEKVNMKVAGTVQSQQFKRWFGDWQNHPERASKVVNEDGTPKVVYHGTSAEFWTFDLNKSGKNYGAALICPHNICCDTRIVFCDSSSIVGQFRQGISRVKLLHLRIFPI